MEEKDSGSRRLLKSDEKTLSLIYLFAYKFYLNTSLSRVALSVPPLPSTSRGMMVGAAGGACGEWCVARMDGWPCSCLSLCRTHSSRRRQRTRVDSQLVSVCFRCLFRGCGFESGFVDMVDFNSLFWVDLLNICTALREGRKESDDLCIKERMEN